MKRNMYQFAWKNPGDRVRTVRIYAWSAREAFSRLADLGICPQYLRGVRTTPCTNKERKGSDA